MIILASLSHLACRLIVYQIFWTCVLLLMLLLVSNICATEYVWVAGTDWWQPFSYIS